MIVAAYPERRLLPRSKDIHLKDLEVPLSRTSRRFALILGVSVTLPLGAQERAREAQSAFTVPASSQPPAGLCRVWLKDVPAGQQPAPTDCATAIRNRPATAQVVFGPRADLNSTSARAPGAFSTVSPPHVSDPPARSECVASKAFVPASPAAAAAPVRSGERPSGARASTVNTTGPVIRLPDPAPPKAPPKPMGYPQS